MATASEVVAILRQHGFTATAEMTGGGIYTVFVGAADPQGYYPAVIGPFDGLGGEAQWADLYVGPENDGEFYANVTVETVDAMIRVITEVAATQEP